MPNHFQIRSVLLDSKREVPVLVRDGVQLYATSCWITDQLLPSITGGSPNTLHAKLRAVAHFLVWVEQTGFEWESAVRLGAFMTNQTIKKVLQWMALEVDLSGTNRTKKLRIAPRSAAQRAAFLFQYLDWYANRIIEAMPSQGYTQTVKAERQNWINSWTTQARAEFRGTVPTRAPEPMGAAQRELFLQVIQPGAPGNPWRKSLQVRNFALLTFLYEHGLRISDVLMLRMDDLEVENEKFRIEERTEDEFETRKRRPNPKRRGKTKRTLRFTPKSLAAMQAWLQDRSQRDRWPGATKKAHVFVSHKAETSDPFSTRRPGQLFKDLRDAYPEQRGEDGKVLRVGFVDDYFHPHALRHNRAVLFVLDYYKKHGCFDKTAEEAMRKLFGWSKDSDQPSYYAEAAWLEIGNVEMLKLCEERTKMNLPEGTEGVE